MELKTRQKVTYDEVADFIGISYEMLTRYRKMEKFSPTVMNNIRYLEEMKVREGFKLNPKHYEEEEEQRWLPSNEAGTVTMQEIYSELQHLSSLMSQKMEIDSQVYAKILKLIDPENRS